MTDKAWLHVRYTFGILLGIIVLLLTIQWGAIPDLIGYLNFALAVSSLILALLAIVYAYVSNLGQSDLVGRLSTASREMFLSADEVKRATSSLTLQVSEIPAVLASMDEKVSTTQKLVMELTVPPNAGAINDNTVRAIDSDAITRRFLDSASLGGLLCLYVAVKAFEAGHAFSLKALTATPGILLRHDYASAFLHASVLASVIGMKTEGKQFRVTRVPSLLHEQLPSRLFEEAALRDQADDEGQPADRVTRLIRNDIAVIDSFFRSPDGAAPSYA